MLSGQTNTKQDIPPLKSLYFYLTPYCNLNCLHCWIAPSYIDKDEAPQEAPFEVLKDIIDQAIPLGLKSIKISGGEPFLNKNIFPLISYASSKNINIIIETNGTLIDEESAKFLKENHLGMVAVSLDGPNKKIHETLRARQGCFEKTVEGIKFLKKYNLNVQVIMAVYKYNSNYLEDTISFAEKLGANSFKINCISAVSRGEALKTKGDTLEVKDYLILNQKIENEIQPRYKIKIILDIPPAFKKIKDIKERTGRCGLKHILGVLANGDISICGIGEVVSALRLGNIRTGTLKHLWKNNPILKILRNGIPQKLEGICSQCIFKGFCMGKCRAEAYYATGNFFSPFFFCDEAYKLGLFPEKNIFAFKKEVLGERLCI